MVIADRRLTPSEQPDYKGFNTIANNIDVPSLVQVQVNSFDWLKTDGLKDLLEEMSPIEDFSGGRFDLRFLSHEVRDPKHTERECRKREITYSAPLYITVQLVIKETGEVKEQTLFFGDVPMMTKNGTFVINGAERVVVSQLVRSPGAYFTTKTDPASGRDLCSAKLIPYRGAWVELEMPVFPPIGFKPISGRFQESADRDASTDSESQIQDTLSVGLGERGDIDAPETLE